MWEESSSDFLPMKILPRSKPLPLRKHEKFIEIMRNINFQFDFSLCSKNQAWSGILKIFKYCLLSGLVHMINIL